MKKVAVFFAEGFEEIEGLTPVDLLRRAGIQVVAVSVTGERLVTGSHAIAFLADALFEEVDFDFLDGLILPGGMPGSLHLHQYKGVNEKAKEFLEAGKLVSAICAAPGVVLGPAGIVEGKRATVYPGREEELAGAQPITDEEVVADGNLVTSRGMGTAIPFALELVRYFLGEEKAEKLRRSIVFQET